MTFLDLSQRDAEHIFDGAPPPARDDLGCVLELTAFMRATGEVEPAPPMSPDLIHLIESARRPTN